MMKVAVAMSGGVDSSVAAALLKEAGYEVIGVTMQVWPPDGAGFGSGGLEVVSQSAEAASHLGIPHYVMDFRDMFAEKIISNFCREYSVGRTPNPCVRCNTYMKFGALLEKAIDLGADIIATGHYAQVERDEANGQYLLRKGIDRGKDQSYFLGMLGQDQLRRTLMPLGVLTKGEVARQAVARGLAGAHRTESQEVCFAPNGDYGVFLSGYMPDMVKPGPIINRWGNVVGEHRGIPFYTIGQRKGLGIASGEPLYVSKVDSERNAVIVGGKEDIYRHELIASGVQWVSGSLPRDTLDIKARIRSRHREAAAVFTPLSDGKGARVKFKRPQMAITPGQTVVFYDGDVVVGGGTIDHVL